MPVKLRRPKARTSRVTDEARAVFAEALQLQPIRSDCNRSIACRSPSVGEHCPECLKYMELDRELDRLLGLRPWITSPLRADSETLPDYLLHNPWQSECWRKARALRIELERGMR